jgi:hypothetical protein
VKIFTDLIRKTDRAKQQEAKKNFFHGNDPFPVSLELPPRNIGKILRQRRALVQDLRALWSCSLIKTHPIHIWPKTQHQHETCFHDPTSRGAG